MMPKIDLSKKYPPSEPCGCEICLGYCAHPGWWLVAEAARAINAGYRNRVMLEVAPDHSFGVLSPAFKGCEGKIAWNHYAANGCNFLKDNLCEIHGAGFLPLECRFCHHDRPGLGMHCHADIEKDWDTLAGRQLVSRWCRLTGVWEYLDFYGLSRLKKL
jgi:hypothetical protein